MPDLCGQWGSEHHWTLLYAVELGICLKLMRQGPNIRLLFLFVCLKEAGVSFAV